MSVATCTRLHAFKPLLILVAVCATVMISIANEAICMQFPPLVTWFNTPQHNWKKVQGNFTQIKSVLTAGNILFLLYSVIYSLSREHKPWISAARKPKRRRELLETWNARKGHQPKRDESSLMSQTATPETENWKNNKKLKRNSLTHHLRRVGV